MHCRPSSSYTRSLASLLLLGLASFVLFGLKFSRDDNRVMDAGAYTIYKESSHFDSFNQSVAVVTDSKNEKHITNEKNNNSETSNVTTVTTGGVVPRCIWSPKPSISSYAGTSCMSTLTQAILGSNPAAAVPRRWMFFGDSTMLRLFGFSPLDAHFVRGQRINRACPGIYQCKDVKHDRCSLPQAFGMKPRDRSNITTDGWIPPNFTLGEGPVANGLQSHYCQDCSGCNSHYTLCTKANTNSTMSSACTAPQNTVHGAYFSVEFARDVELQTNDYPTTQENVAAFIHSHINHDAILNQEMGGPPICLVSMGIHDMNVPNITVDLFVQNMKWLLQDLLQSQCSHLIWLPNASPVQQHRGGPYKQSQESIKEWNDAVSNQVMPLLLGKASILDVFDASIGWPHDNSGKDNVHMEHAWYHALGSFLLELSQNVLLQVEEDNGIQQSSFHRFL